MKSWPAKALLLAGAAVLLAPIPALGQDERPNRCCRPASAIRKTLPPPEEKAPPHAAHATQQQPAAPARP